LDPPSEVSLAYLSAAAYKLEETVNLWHLKASVSMPTLWFNGTAHAALYRKEEADHYDKVHHRKCAVVFAVDADLATWTHLPDSKKPYDMSDCGIKQAHRGQLLEFQQLLLSSSWDSFDTELEHCEEMYAGGHGVGGALATFYATCANGAGDGRTTVPALIIDGKAIKQAQTRIFMNVSGLYTYGAPGVSFNEQLLNKKAPDGTFAGGRFYNEDTLFFDILPFEGSEVLKLLHPKVAAIRLQGADSGWVERKEYEAVSEDARREPSYYRKPVPRESDMSTYLARVHRAPQISDLTDPGIFGKSTTVGPVHLAHLKKAEQHQGSTGWQANLSDGTHSKDSWAVPKGEPEIQAKAQLGFGSASVIAICLSYIAHLHNFAS
jgi:hypothetical protein